MKEKIRNLASGQRRYPQYRVETLESLPEDAFSAVFVFFELGSCILIRLAAPLITTLLQRAQKCLTPHLI